MSFWKNGVEAAYINFNATNKSSLDWFAFQRVKETSWTSLKSEPALWFDFKGYASYSCVYLC